MQVGEALGLKSLVGCIWAVEPVCAVTGEGLDVAVETMFNLIVKKKLRDKRNRNKTR